MNEYIPEATIKAQEENRLFNEHPLAADYEHYAAEARRWSYEGPEKRIAQDIAGKIKQDIAHR